MEKAIQILKSMQSLFEEGGEKLYAQMILRAVSGNDVILWDFLTSNELWGGAGSIADQGLIEDELLRNKLNSFLIELGKEQKRKKKVNSRTDMWVKAFKKWKKSL